QQFVAQGNDLVAPTHYEDFIVHPLSIWIEDTFGLQEKDGRLARQEPRSIQSAAKDLSRLTDVDEVTCASAIQNWLLAGYRCSPDPNTGYAPFAFRLHQFISPGDTVYATIESEPERHITLNGQHYMPGDRDKVLFPLCFCRECGQEYYTVRITTNKEGEK